MFVLTVTTLTANNIQVVSVVPGPDFKTITIELTWENSWQLVGSNTNQDGAWVFIKYKNRSSSQWEHLTIDTVSSYTSTSGALGASAVLDNQGIRVSHKWFFSDTFGLAQIQLVANIGDASDLDNPSFKVFAIEMVRPKTIYGEGVELGDGVSHNRFHPQGDSLSPFTAYFGTSITCGNLGQLNTTSEDLESGTIPADYPFLRTQWVMKHEISQIQYVQFLNCLTRAQQNTRTETDLEDAGNNNRYVMSDSPGVLFRNGIARDTGHGSGPFEFYMDLNGNGVPSENNDGQNVACNYLSPKDVAAYLDWAGLRPMSELEYEYLCRYTDPAVMNEYAWGNTALQLAIVAPSTAGRPGERAIEAGADGLTRSTANGPMRTGFAANDTTDRVKAGASQIGLLDMTGNVAELVTSVGLESDRGFHFQDNGDGKLTIQGNANQPTWPSNFTVRGRAADGSTIWTVSRRGTALALGRNEHHGGRGAQSSF